MFQQVAEAAHDGADAEASCVVHQPFDLQYVPLHPQALGDFGNATGKCWVSEAIDDGALHVADHHTMCSASTELGFSMLWQGVPGE